MCRFCHQLSLLLFIYCVVYHTKESNIDQGFSLQDSTNIGKIQKYMFNVSAAMSTPTAIKRIPGVTIKARHKVFSCYSTIYCISHLFLRTLKTTYHICNKHQERHTHSHSSNLFNYAQKKFQIMSKQDVKQNNIE